MDEYDELYGVSGGNNDSYYGNQDIYGDDQDNSQSYDPEKATLYSNQPNKAEGQSQQEKSDNNPTYDQQQQYYGSDADNTRDQPKQREYDQAHEQDQSNQSVEGQEEHESHPSVASAANQDEGKMFVGGLNWETTDERLRDYFSKFGEVLDCVVMRDAATGKSRGFAFLTFADSRVVDDVASRPHQLDGKNIDPKRAVPRDEQDKTEKIFVGGIHQDVDEEEFRDYFSQFGKVIDVTLMTDRATGRPRGFGFVTFESSQGVDNALHMTGLAMRGKPVEVKKAMPKHRQQQQSQGGGDSHGVAVNPYFNMYGKQGGSRYAGAANSMGGGNQGGRGGWYGGGGAGGGAGNNGGMYGNYYGGGGNYPQNYQMMAAAAAAYYNRYMGYYQQQQQQQSNYDQGSYQDDSYEEGNDGGNDYSDQDRSSGGDQYSSGGQNDRYNDGGRGNQSRDPRRDPRSSSSSYSSGNDRNSRGNSNNGGGGAVYASQSNRNHHNYRPY